MTLRFTSASCNEFNPPHAMNKTIHFPARAIAQLAQLAQRSPAQSRTLQGASR
ncbi:hypothetical protein [Burkholderia stagnalis]|uniref:hypothetical protein n=1 Tax=Burkholderia stagnalis TaxID=1503054 RepID=UPI000A51CEA0|nr:hypothetical protein [Burkholderia stagnalis]